MAMTAAVAAAATVAAVPRGLRFGGALPRLRVFNNTNIHAHRTRWSSSRAKRGLLLCRCHFEVQLEHNGETHVFQVEDGETVLEKALEAGLDVPHDCKLGVCMTCPARLLEGSVDQSGGMLSDDVVEKGYALLCTSVPLSNCRFRVIPEEELLSLQLVTANM